MPGTEQKRARDLTNEEIDAFDASAAEHWIHRVMQRLYALSKNSDIDYDKMSNKLISAGQKGLEAIKTFLKEAVAILRPASA